MESEELAVELSQRTTVTRVERGVDEDGVRGQPVPPETVVGLKQTLPHVTTAMSGRYVARDVSCPQSDSEYDIIDVMSDIVPSESAEDRGERVDRLLRHVRPIVLASARVVEGHVQGYGWTVGSRAVVQVLVEGGAATVPQIAARLDLARQNVQRHVDALVELGHVARRANPEHRRSVLIEPTPEGRSTFATMHATELGELASLARAST